METHIPHTCTHLYQHHEQKPFLEVRYMMVTGWHTPGFKNGFKLVAWVVIMIKGVST